MFEPLASPRIIERPALIRRLRAAMTTGHVLLAAPAGYGKSTLLRTFAHHEPHTRALSLTAAERDPATLQDKLAPYLDSRTEPQPVLVLDDVHLLAEGSEACRWLVQQLGRPEPRWLLAGRYIPFETASLQIAGELTLFGKAALAFSPAEAAMLIDKADGADETLVHWRDRVAGWPLALSLLSRLATSTFVAPDEIARTERHLFTYLASTVFAQLPDDVRRFMTVTAVPLHFNRGLARMLWEDAEEAEALLSRVEQLNLYLEPAGSPDYFRYHALIREFLLQSDDAEPQLDQKALAERTVRWFEEHDDLDIAVEQALASHLPDHAERLISGLKLHYFHKSKSYLTYRRWVMALPPSSLAANPMLLVRLGNVLSQMGGYVHEAWTHIRRAIELAYAQEDEHCYFLAKTNLALLHYRVGELETARVQMQEVLQDARCEGYARAYGLRIATLIGGDLARYAELPAYFAEAIALTEALGTKNEPFMNRANWAWLYHTPLGNFDEAEWLLQNVLTHFAHNPGWLSQYLVYWCELQAAKGDWTQLAETLARLDEVLETVEEPGMFPLLWRQHYRSLLAVVEYAPAGGEAPRADDNNESSVQHELVKYAALAEQYPINQVCVTWLAAWHLRRQGRWADAIARAEPTLAQGYEAPYQLSRLALERDIAQGLCYITGETTSFQLHEATKQILQQRTRPQIARLRALLVIVCQHENDPRWRRHWAAVLRLLERPGYAQLLTTRDPELGLYFWRIGLAEGLALPQTKRALVQIGHWQPLVDLLRHKDSQVCQRTAAVLADIGHEQAMPHLFEAMQNEADVATQAALESALAQLEAQPPPALSIQLLGGFTMRRGASHITPDAWSRPVVLRLFQYFALHAGAPLTKDKILDDLWPDADPRRAWNNFRTLYSLLRKVLEPHMRPKAPNRYFAVLGDTYTFDPEHCANIDLLHFTQTVEHTLAQCREHTAFPLPPEFLTALETYQPILPELTYEEWLQIPRRRAQDRFVEGAIFAAQALLHQGHHADAVTWFHRALAQAPWLEEGYQLLMRAYARQGQRALALRTFRDAATHLKQELDVEPSPQTQWLADRLAAGESI